MVVHPDCWTDEYLSEPDEILRFTHPRFGRRFYIPALGLPLLKARHGDFIAGEPSAGEPARFVFDMLNPNREGVPVDFANYIIAAEEATIVQHGGVAFIWPEKEAKE